MTMSEHAERFTHLRPLLFTIVYEILGSATESDDVLQDSYLRWAEVDLATVRDTKSYLAQLVTRQALNTLREGVRRREDYIGPWLPEPLLISDAASPADNLELASNLSLAFLVLLERLAPVERAAFLLHDIFDLGYAEIARIVGKTEAAARQLIHRARERVRRDQPRFAADEAEREKLIRQFSAASQAGDEAALLALFADEIALASDGGGKVNAARKIVRGREKIARLFAVTGRKFGRDWRTELMRVNGELGLVTYADEKVIFVTAFVIADGRIASVYRVMNPDKLEKVSIRCQDTKSTKVVS